MLTYEDLSEYEMEPEVGGVGPPSTKKRGKTAGKPRPAKHRQTTKATNVEVSTKAFVVHAIPCNRPIADTIQDFRKIGMRGILGSQWLLGGNRRIGKTTSSVVIFLDREVSFQAQDGQLKMKVRGQWHPVEVYDFEGDRF